jgi:hypothetical protein
MAEKAARARVMSELRGRLDKAQQHYISAAREVGGAIRDFSAHPREAVERVAGSARSRRRRCSPTPTARSC